MILMTTSPSDDPVEATVIRASSLPNYPDCPLRWAIAAIPIEILAAGYDLRTIPRGIGATNGTAVHAAVAHLLTVKMDTGEVSDQKGAVEIGITRLDEQLAGDEEIQWDTTTPTRDVAQKQIISQSDVYATDVAPDINPIAVEEAIEATIKPGYVLSGHVDVTEEFDLHDLKTGRNQRANSAQYGGYSLLRRSTGGVCNELVEDYVRRGSIAKPQHAPERVVYDAPRAERQAMQIIKRIVADVNAFRDSGDTDTFVQNPNTYLCSDKFCRAWGTNACNAWKPKPAT